jgi:hypothetical protein
VFVISFPSTGSEMRAWRSIPDPRPLSRAQGVVLSIKAFEVAHADGGAGFEAGVRAPQLSFSAA